MVSGTHCATTPSIPVAIEASKIPLAEPDLGEPPASSVPSQEAGLMAFQPSRLVSKPGLVRRFCADDVAAWPASSTAIASAGASRISELASRKCLRNMAWPLSRGSARPHGAAGWCRWQTVRPAGSLLPRARSLLSSGEPARSPTVTSMVYQHKGISASCTFGGASGRRGVPHSKGREWGSTTTAENKRLLDTEDCWRVIFHY